MVITQTIGISFTWHSIIAVNGETQSIIAGDFHLVSLKYYHTFQNFNDVESIHCINLPGILCKKKKMFSVPTIILSYAFNENLP